VANNVFAGRSGKQLLLLQANSTTGVSLDHNLWLLDGVAQPFLWGATVYDHGGWVAATAQGAGDVLGDPQLAGSWALPAANLRPAPGSPVIDRGTSLASVTSDFEGGARPAGAGFDIGAFELGAFAPDGGAPQARPDPDAAPLPPATEGSGKDTGCGCHIGGRPAKTAPGTLALLTFASVLLLAGLVTRSRPGD